MILNAIGGNIIFNYDHEHKRVSLQLDFVYHSELIIDSLNKDLDISKIGSVNHSSGL
jgi:hypothetical protein